MSASTGYQKKTWGNSSNGSAAPATASKPSTGNRPANQVGEIVYRVKKAGASRDEKLVTVANLFKNTDTETGKISHRLSVMEPILPGEKYFVFENTFTNDLAKTDGKA